MKFEVVRRDVYEKTDGPIGLRRATPAETLELLERLRKLPIDSLLLVEPPKGIDIKSFRARLYARSVAIQKLYKPGFVIRFAISQDQSKVILWKELPGPTKP